MRVLMLSRTTPYLPTHERPRLAAAHLLDQLSARHALALIAPRGRADARAQGGVLDEALQGHAPLLLGAHQ